MRLLVVPVGHKFSEKRKDESRNTLCTCSFIDLSDAFVWNLQVPPGGRHENGKAGAIGGILDLKLLNVEIPRFECICRLYLGMSAKVSTANL
jgi:hypothetical protein